MKSHLIRHASDQPMVIIYTEYVAICDNSHCAAALLQVFEYWTERRSNHKPQAAQINAERRRAGKQPNQKTDLWIYRTRDQLRNDLLKLYGHSEIAKAIRLLKEKNYIKSRRNPRVKFDATIQYLLNTKLIQEKIDAFELANRTVENNEWNQRKNVIAINESSEAIQDHLIDDQREDTSASPLPAINNASMTINGLTEVITLYEQNITATIPSTVLTSIKEWLTDGTFAAPKQNLIDAITIAAKKNKRTWAYVEGILKNMQNEGVKTADGTIRLLPSPIPAPLPPFDINADVPIVLPHIPSVSIYDAGEK